MLTTDAPATLRLVRTNLSAPTHEEVAVARQLVTHPGVAPIADDPVLVAAGRDVSGAFGDYDLRLFRRIADGDERPEVSERVVLAVASRIMSRELELRAKLAELAEALEPMPSRDL